MYIIKIKKWIIKCSTEFYYVLCRLSWKFIQTSEQKIQFTTSALPDLCPTSDAQNIDAYENHLTELLLNHNKVKEIAITSPYSGGKSSFIDTYIRKHPYHKYTNISLVDFKNTRNNETNNLVQQIEQSIVQQILYRIKDTEMPNSRFRKIVMSKPTWHWLIAQPLGILTWLISLSIIIFPTSNAAKAIIGLMGSDGISTGLLDFSSMYLFIFPYLVLKDLYSIINKFNVTKLNLIKGEMTFDPSSNDSVFNLHLEEIIYYFAVTKSNVVIFEDIDRFDKPELFIKFKEINKLINDCAEVEQKVVFIYALKDDMFKDSDRTKFFDAIIPIIPITNSANSYPQLSELLKSSDLIEGIDDKFLRDVSIFIEDMRVLKNIVTEYGIYKLTLNGSVKKSNLYKLLSFIIYKNIYCDDFAKLQDNKGILAEFIKQKKVLQLSISEDIQDEINQLEQSLVDISSEKLTSIEELNRIYIFTILEQIQHDGIWQINGHTFKTIIDKGIFESLWKANPKINYRLSNNSVHNLNHSFCAFDNNLIPSFTNRKMLITRKNNLYSDKTLKELKQLRDQQKRSLSYSIKELIKNLSEETIFEKLTVHKIENTSIDNKKYNLLIHLLEKGYIDEMYGDYIYPFIEGHITEGDRDFILGVKSNQTVDRAMQLSNLDTIFEYLNSDDYQSPSIFNYDLINYLIKNDKTIFVTSIVNTIAYSTDVNEKTVFTSLDYIFEQETWLNIIVSNWDDFWVQVITSESLITEEINLFLSLLLTKLYINEDRLLIPVNDIFPVSAYISDIANFGKYIPKNTLSYIKLVKALAFIQVKFSSLSTLTNDDPFINDIVSNQLFNTNLNNYRFLLSFFSDSLHDNAELSFTELYEVDNEILLECINDDINNFVTNIILDKSVKMGKPEHSLFILNHSELSLTNKEAIIIHKNFLITDVAEITELSLSHLLIEHNKVEPTWDNILNYLVEDIPEETLLINFLNHEKVISSLVSMDSSESTDVIDEYVDEFIQLLLEESLTVSSFTFYAPLFKEELSMISLSEVAEDKIEVLIKLGIIEFNEDNYNEISEDYKSLLLLYIGNNYQYAIKEEFFNQRCFEIDELILILNTNNLETYQKLHLSKMLKGSVNWIPKNFFLQYIKLYNDMDNFSIPLNILRLLISDSDAETSEKVILLAEQIEFIDKDITFELLNALGSNYMKIATTRSYATIKKNSYNIHLAKSLESKGYFSVSSRYHFGKIRLNKKWNVS